jgi:mannitol-1-phosphate/altronate dehydrogenase
MLESISDKITISVLIALKSIFKKLKIMSLVSDEEALFISKPAFKDLDKKNTDYSIVTEQRYNNLSIIDRFIRITHDWMRKNLQWNYTPINRSIAFANLE